MDIDTGTAHESRDHEVRQYLDDTATLVIDTATQGGAVYASQSFEGNRRNSAILVCLVACPSDLVLDVQEAIDQAVARALDRSTLSEAKIQ